VIRPTWSAETEDQRKAFAEAVRLAKVAKRADEAMWAAILKARTLDVPDLQLCEGTGVARSTLNRRFGTRAEPRDVPDAAE
jgi:hypothetical protein